MNVTMPDGTVIQGVPDDATREQVLAKWKANGGVMPPESKENSPTLTGELKSAATGGVKGLIASTLGAPGDLADLGQSVMSNLSDNVREPTGTGFFPRSHEIYSKLPDLHTPENKVEKVTEAGASGVASMLNPAGWFGKGKVLGKAAAVMGGVGGAGGELAAEAFPEHPDLARAATFLAALSPGAYSGMRKPNVVKATQDYTREVGPSGLQAADETRKEAATRLGTDTLLSQGTDASTALSNITRDLKDTPQGIMLRKVLEKQPLVGQEKIDQLVGALSDRPLNQATANDILDTGHQAVYTGPEDAQKRLTRPVFAKAKDDYLPSGTIGDIIQDIKGRTQEANLTGTKGAAPSVEAQKRLTAMDSTFPNGVPVLNVDKAGSQAGRAARMARENPMASTTDVTNAPANAIVASAIGDTTKAASPALAGGKMVHQTAQDWLVDPIQKGAPGASFPGSMVKGGVGDFEIMGKVLSDPVKYGPSDIAQVASELNRVDPTAFPTLVKQKFATAQEKSLTPREGRLTPTAVGDFATDVAGSKASRQRDNFRETMKQVALAHGADPAAAVKGAEELVDALHVISREQGGVGMSSQFQQGAGANIFSLGMKSANLIAPMQGIGRAVERAVYKDTYAKLADALTSPDGVRKLIAIANWSRPREMAITTARGIIATSADVQSAP